MNQVRSSLPRPLGHARCRCSPRRRLSAAIGGFSLVEVLVAILILSLGLLGMVGMQALALQANRDASRQSLATALAGELAELIRGNREAGLLGSSSPYLGHFNSPLKFPAPSDCLNVVAGGSCADAVALAHAQMTDWLARMERELPGARVEVCLDAAPFDADGMPQWNCTAGVGAMTIIKLGWVQAPPERWKAGSFLLDRATRPSVILPLATGASA